MKTVAIIQARLGSSRLPRKVLLDISGKSMLERVVDRVSRCLLVDDFVIATTDQQQDRELIEFCNDHQWNWFAGNEADVLQRYVDAARQVGADQFVRITSDCPLVDPAIIDQVIVALKSQPPQAKPEVNNPPPNLPTYACNFYPERRFPRGLDCEAFTEDTLAYLDRHASQTEQREHVTLYACQNPQEFSIGSVRAEQDWSGFRWTVDTKDDLKLVREIYQYFGERIFSWNDVIEACLRHPEWNEINAHIRQKIAQGVA